MLDFIHFKVPQKVFSIVYLLRTLFVSCKNLLRASLSAGKPEETLTKQSPAATPNFMSKYSSMCKNSDKLKNFWFINSSTTIALIEYCPDYHTIPYYILPIIPKKLTSALWKACSRKRFIKLSFFKKNLKWLPLFPLRRIKFVNIRARQQGCPHPYTIRIQRTGEGFLLKISFSFLLLISFKRVRNHNCSIWVW